MGEEMFICEKAGEWCSEHCPHNKCHEVRDYSAHDDSVPDCTCSEECGIIHENVRCVPVAREEVSGE